MPGCGSRLSGPLSHAFPDPPQDEALWPREKVCVGLFCFEAQSSCATLTVAVLLECPERDRAFAPYVQEISGLFLPGWND